MDKDLKILATNQLFIQRIQEDFLQKPRRLHDLLGKDNDAFTHASLLKNIINNKSWSDNYTVPFKSPYKESQWLTSYKIKDNETDKYIILLNDLDDMAYNQSYLYFLANYDILTKCGNRHLLTERFKIESAACLRRKKILAIAFLDIDNFKAINDQYGHILGDMIIKESGVRLLELIRLNDLVCRFGGDEFVILLTDFNHFDEAALVLDRILERLHQPIFINQELSLLIHFSQGLAMHDNADQSLDDLLVVADQKMFEAKRAYKAGK